MNKHTPEYITTFLEAVYPGKVELILGTFDEKTTLEDATRLIGTLLEALKDLAERRGHPGDRLDRALAAIALASPQKSEMGK